VIYLVFSEKTVGEFFEEQVKKQSDREFMVYPDRNLRFSYTEFNERVNRLAKGLLSIGISKRDHVGIWARNVPDWLTFMFATAKIGAVLVTVNTAYKSHEVDYILKQSDMKAIAIVNGFRDTNYIKTLYELVPQLKTGSRENLDSDVYPFLEKVIYIGQEKHRGMYNTNELMLLGKHQNDDELNRVKSSLNNNDVINIQYTPGTTGFPKGVMLTHRNILNNGFSIGERMKFSEIDRLCIPVPLFHCFGIGGGVLSVLTHGGTIVMLEIFDPLLALSAIQKEKCTAIHGVPTMFIAELNHPMFDTFDLSSLRTGIMAGSTCPIETMKEVMDKMNMTEITIAYGLTESSPTMTQTSADDSLERKANTVGRKYENIEVRIVDPETNEPLEPKKIGEICCRGYNVMKGYYKNADKTKDVIDDEGWLHSGDLATVDEDGYYTIIGRIKDMIIRGGENIHTREIEEFLFTIDGIRDVQVAGIADPKYGEIVGAFIIKEDDIDLREEDIRDYAIDKIARYKVPKHVFFLDEFPLTTNGKIKKHELSELGYKLLQKRLKEDELNN